MQIRVRLFQAARICTEEYMVEADSADEAKQQVVDQLADRLGAMTNGAFDLEAETVQKDSPQPAQPQQVAGSTAQPASSEGLPAPQPQQ